MTARSDKNGGNHAGAANGECETVDAERSLEAGDFAEFIQEVHGYAPYKWQAELARTVCRTGRWPRYLDMPTAAGKTCAMDIAVFHLALDAHARAGREAPLRIAYVVDRRLVVDGALAHAQRLAEGIDRRGGPVTRLVADRLGAFSPDGPPLDAVRLRGGMPVDNDWAATPSQPTVIVSTVDQVGSRLLFRGYGVSDRMRPVHAGLLGRDTLYLIDEAHLSRPFMDTLATISKMDDRWEERTGVPIRFMFMSATPGGDAREEGDVFPPPGKAGDLLRADEGLARRLGAHKLARLVEVPASADRSASIVDEAIGLAYPKKGRAKTSGDDDRPPVPRRIGVVLNRVALARRVHGLLREKVEEIGGDKDRVHLLTGRARPIDRDRVVGPELGRIMPGGDGDEKEDAEKEDDAQPYPSFFVATQCIEVGVDADFDVLVTQVAPIDSLRQRFGRLDRAGRRGRSDAAIVASRDEIAKKSTDPIYGDSLPAAWAYLKGAAEKKIVDFGAFYFPLRDGMDKAIAPRARSAALMPAYVRAWWQTLPRPDPDPDPAVFLHGVGAGSPADVQVVWRADITGAMLRDWHRRGRGGADIDMAGLAVCRPSQLEAVPLPVWIVRRWLEGRRSYPLGDLEGAADGAGDAAGAGDRGDDEAESSRRTGGAAAAGAEPCALLWRDPKEGETRSVLPCEIAPGDMIVVPAERGGCDMYGWDEKSRDAVADLGMEASLAHRHILAIRLNRPYLSSVCTGAVAAALMRLSVELADEGADAVLDAIAGTDGIPDEWSRMLACVRSVHGTKSGGRSGTSRWGRTFMSRTALGDGRTAIAGVGIRLDPVSARILNRHTEHGVDCRYVQMPWGAPWAKARACSVSADRAALLNALKESPWAKAWESKCDSAGGSRPPSLSEHSRGVARLAGEFCDRIGIGSGLRGDLVLAATLHDAGKAERRVQSLLRGVDPGYLPRDGSEPVAKSAAGTGAAAKGGHAKYARALRMAHLPMGYRHECWSVLMAHAHPAMKKAHDRDLSLYAVGTHHGYGRPLFPPVVDRHAAAADDVWWLHDGVEMTAPADHGLAELDSAWHDICERLYARYGPWRLAHMEAVVRLADHCQSRAEGGTGGGGG